MPRLARAVAPGCPHHITQRGNRRQTTFFRDEDYQAYLSLMAEWCGRCDVRIRAYCLMPNHVHLIVVPATPEGMCRAVGEAHRRYTGRVVGEKPFVRKPESRLGRTPLPKKRGRPGKPGK